MKRLLFGVMMTASAILAVGAMTPAAAQTGHDHQAAPAAMACCGGQAQTAATPAAMPCCQGHDHQMAQADMACCKDGAAPKAQAMTCCGNDAASTALALSVLLPEATVQTTTVTFRDPVRVGSAVLMGRYVIEHDNDRMARGEPCTFIYAERNRVTPVVTFHCTHLERETKSADTVVLRRSVDPVRQLVEFQFAGETASHGVPNVR